MQSFFRIILVAVALSLAACKTQNASVLRVSTELESESVNLKTYLATPEVLAAYRKEYNRDSSTPQFPDVDFFCMAATNTRALPSCRSHQLPYHKLHDEEIIAIANYSFTIFANLNKALRYNDNKAKTEYKYSILTTASALNRLPPYLGKVYRGSRLTPTNFAAYSEALKSGRNVVEKSFLSTSLDRKVSDAFARMSGREGESATFIISAKQGRLIEGISLVGHEREVLFSPGSEFRVVSITAKTMEEYEALFANAPQLPAMARVNESSDPIPKIKGCESVGDISKFEANKNDRSGDGASRFVDPPGDLSKFPAPLFLSEEEWAKEYKGKIIVVEMEEVTPS